MSDSKFRPFSIKFSIGKKRDGQPKKFDRTLIAKRIFLSLALILVFVAGGIAGISYDRSRQTLDLSTFWTVYQKIQNEYVGGSLDKTKAVEGAIKGLVESIGDPYSVYLPASQKQSLDDELSGKFEGIGAELTNKDGAIVVVAPISGSPAEKAGLKANDVVLTVDGNSTDGKTLNDVVSEIRGPKGTVVKLTVGRSGVSEPVSVEITRDSIVVKSVTSKMIGNIAYVEISQFGDDTVSLAQQQVKDLAAKNPRAIIIDLRNNPGGFLNSVPPVAGLFITPSVVVQEKDKNGHVQQLKSTDVPVMPNTPMYILVNSGSASAAEILAGALQDYGRAKLVGEKTFGKGSVQDLIDLPGGAALKLTIDEWLTPKGRTINKTGIEPDVKVTDNKTDTSDPVLDKALELAKQ